MAAYEEAGRIIPRGGNAVMSTRREPPESLDFFPTPPWATRALVEHVLLWTYETPETLKQARIWEPAAGEGHMADVLAEYCDHVHASDVNDYGRPGFALGSFVGAGLDVAQWPSVGGQPDWIITNPPFNEATAFYDRARADAKRGVALLLRTAWLEGVARYRDVFRQDPPHVALFTERVPMHRGRWEPDGSTTTSYAWLIWEGAPRHGDATLSWIPPCRRKELTRPDDRARFAPHTVDQNSDQMEML